MTLRLVQVVTARPMANLFNWYGWMVTTLRRRRRRSALELATLDAWWHVFDEVDWR